MSDQPFKYVAIRINDEVVGISKYPEKRAVRARGLFGSNPDRIIIGFDLEEISETEYTTLEAFKIPILEPNENGHIDLSLVLSKDVTARYEIIFQSLEKLTDNVWSYK